jgi:hypothetical protein
MLDSQSHPKGATMHTVDSATVLGDRTVQVGSRVKHYGQRWTGCATATVIAINVDVPGFRPDWARIAVRQDDNANWPTSVWDWDRTEVAPDL